jgi:uncharacterized protein (TIGR02687 family)
MSDRIFQALNKLFEHHRIVFWYDTKQELRDDFEALQLTDVEKIEINNNEFGIKYQILREQPEQKFLIYKAGSQPDDLDNWLLDVQLAHGEFRADQVSLWLSELDLGPEFADVVKDHASFYKEGKRKEKLRSLLSSDDTPSKIRLKMLAVCAKADPRLDSILENLLEEFARDRDEKIKLIERCQLSQFLWEQMQRNYGYRSESPGMQDFVIELFKSCYAMETNGQANLTSDALVFLKRWKDSRQFEESFESLSHYTAGILNIEQDLRERDFREVLSLDYFYLIDQKILSDLVREVARRTVSSNQVAEWIRQRRQSHWYKNFKDLYEAINYAALFFHALDQATLAMESMADGIQRYSQSWYRIDQLYRKFTFHVRESGQTSLMKELSEQIENFYSNNYLLKLNDRWQSVVDAAHQWEATPVPLQKNFFQHWVQPFLNQEKKVCVIISDALRYEVGEELVGLFRQENRYDANLETALSMLPSYTQLGMAALLPHQNLVLNETAAVTVDGCNSQGLEYRQKILESALGKNGKAIKAEQIMDFNQDQRRALLREHDILYIYHNRIDITGDTRDSEERVFEEVEKTYQDLINLVKKLANANVSNFLITSDHGFIYQNRALEDSDFLLEEVDGETISYRNRRFVLGKGLKEASGLQKFDLTQLGLTGEIEVQIPKSINRLRLRGSGSRFVHGGASLQEVTIPIVKINKKRQDDVSVVDVEILSGASTTITAGQFAVKLYQTQPKTEKVQPRFLRAGIYTQQGELISNSHELTFDFTSENPREREITVRFVLTSKADDVNGQEVILRLDEKLSGTSHYREYKSMRYLMRRAFTNDFDF